MEADEKPRPEGVKKSPEAEVAGEGPSEIWVPDPRVKLPDAAEWAAAHVHARAEKAMARCFHSWQVPFYLPLIRRARYQRGRKVEAFVPLFAGYIFFDRAAVERQQVLETNKVAKILEAPDPERLRGELSSLAIALGADVALKEYRFGEPGSRVLVVRGPLRGVEGILVRYQGKDRLILQIQMIGRAVLADVEIDMCEPL